MARPFIIYIIAEGGIHMALIHTIVNYYDRHQILPERELRFMQYTLEALWNECIKTVLFGLYFGILGRLSQYVLVCCVLLPLRWFSGGMHCSSFRNCLIISFLYINALIWLPPLLPYTAIWIELVFIFCGAILSLPHIPCTPALREISNPTKISWLRRLFLFDVIFWFIVCIGYNTNFSLIHCILCTIISQQIQLLFSRKSS